jgi:hypothetical protein
LEHVLSFVGPGHWLFVAEVTEQWQEIYAMIPETYLPNLPSDFFEKTRSFRCHPETTLGQAVFASPSRLRWAHAAGLSIVKMRYTAGWFADQETLAVAAELESGLLELDSVVYGAAASGSCNID